MTTTFNRSSNTAVADVAVETVTDYTNEIINTYGLSSIDNKLVLDKFFTNATDEMLNNIESDMFSTALAEDYAYMAIKHYEYSVMSAQICIRHLKKNIVKIDETSFSDTISKLHKLDLIDDGIKSFIEKNSDKLNEVTSVASCKFLNYFGFKTLERSYLLKDTDRTVLETPEYMYMRVSCGIHGDVNDDSSLVRVLETYHYLSEGLFTHATPTLFNAGTKNAALSSCYLATMKSDSIEGIFKTFSDCAMISKYAGGIGLAIQDIRATGSYIKGTNGQSNGIVPMLRVLNELARYVDQCFSGDTIVYSKNDGPIEIRNVSIGDKILSSSGNYRTVKRLLRHDYAGTMLEISVEGSVKPVSVTHTHQIMALKSGSPIPDYCDAKELRVGDYVCFPKVKEGMIVDIEEYSYDDMYFFGHMVAGGSISRTTGNPLCSLSIAANGIGGSRSIRNVEFVTRYLVDNVFTYSSKSKDGIVTYHWSPNRPGFKFTHKQLYCNGGNGDKNNNNETGVPSMFMNLPNEKLECIIQGMRDNGISSASSLLIHKLERWMDIRTNPNEITYARVELITESTPFTGNTVYDFEVEGEHTYVTEMGIVHNGGGKRKGSVACYIEPHHDDIFDFLQLRKNHGKEDRRCRDLFLGLWISDLFMKRVEADEDWTLMCPNECPGLSDVHSDAYEELYTRYEREGKGRRTVKAQALWFKILESQIETGTPYMLYKDACNSKSNHQHLGTIKTSNLCVAGDTMILTSKGYYPIKSLKGEDIEVWNGKEFAPTVVHQTGSDQKLLTVNFDNGMTIRCTPYHRFCIETGSSPSERSAVPVIVEAKDLTPNMKIIHYVTPTIIYNNNNEDEEGLKLEHAYTQGLFAAAEGTYSKSVDGSGRGVVPTLRLYGEKKNLLQHVDYLYANDNFRCECIDIDLPLLTLQDKFFVPMNCDLQSRIAWLEGYLDGDGYVYRSDGTKGLQVESIHKEFLINVFYMLQTLGVCASISHMKKSGLRKTPTMMVSTSSNGQQQQHLCKDIYRLSIDCFSLMHLIDDLGFNPKRLDVTVDIRPSPSSPNTTDNKFVSVVNVVDNNEHEDTYCFNEPKEEMGIFNGILTKQCSEVLQFSSPEEVAVCNLASIALPKFVKEDKSGYDFEKLHDIAKYVTKNLNRVIDVNFYPIPEAEKSNMRHRPIGIGVQGLSDTFQMLRLPFESPEARELNKNIFETIYHAALESSIEEAVIYGPHESFVGSPASKGIFQFDMWKKNENENGSSHHSGMYDWDQLRMEMTTKGLRNSLLVAPMPTASTSQILGNTEAFEPCSSNLYMRRVLSGEFIVINPHLIKEMTTLGLWTPENINLLIADDGSVKNMKDVPQWIKDVYKTVWEVKQKSIIDMSADRGIYIDQTQSMNLFLEAPTNSKLSSAHFHAWKKGLKTGSYYIRSRPAANPIKFTVDLETMKQLEETKNNNNNNNNNNKQSSVVETTTATTTTATVTETNKNCKWRRKNAPVDEDCLACGS